MTSALRLFNRTSPLSESVSSRRTSISLPGTILKGTVVSQIGNDVIVEVGLKSEGIVDASDFESSEEIVPGKEIEVLPKTHFLAH
ncbi:hypothetical protein ES703_116487 [subsurface metagenome]